ncbi:hypothetical protein [Shewanella sp. 38A_GOM-205m]|uniref:hypothetical protein n=1 Tax=Shewanella sp. 38A_GOM-205m TaxID=1380363 RepID=UPI00048D64CA|nr:hypothetical protein [Shewanella sp. 38A_GOM-205m]
MPEGIFFVVFFAVLIWVLFVFFTKKGKGIMFGGKIIKTYDGVSAKRKIFSNKVKVHAVDGGAVRFVGLEISVSSIGSYQMIPVTFPANEARQLAALLIEAAEYKENA